MIEITIATIPTTGTPTTITTSFVSDSFPVCSPVVATSETKKMYEYKVFKYEQINEDRLISLLIPGHNNCHAQSAKCLRVRNNVFQNGRSREF